jgi:hypothetical protein
MHDNRFGGHWALSAAKPYWPGLFAFHITEYSGICTVTNSPKKCPVGDIAFIIKTTSGNRFRGKQLFTDGKWRNVGGELIGNDLLLKGGGWDWVMTRRAEDRPIDAAQSATAAPDQPEGSRSKSPEPGSAIRRSFFRRS